MLAFNSKKILLLLLTIVGIVFIINPSIAGTLNCSVTTAANCTGTIAYRMSDTKDAHAALYNQTGTPYDSNVVCCTGITGLGNSCSGNYATVLKLSAIRNAHVQQTGSYANNACLSAPSNTTISIGYQASNCRGYDTILGSMSNTTNAQVGNNTAYTTKICGTATVTPVISISIDDGIISYGTLAAGTTKTTYDLSDTQTITNEGNVPIDISIEGHNTDAWQLNGSGADSYDYLYCKTTENSCSSATSNYEFLLADIYLDLYTNVLPNGTRDIDLEIIMPTSTSSLQTQSPEITMLATEHAWTCGETVTFSYNGNTVTYGTIKSTTGNCWMDRNLGATQVATSFTGNTAAWGDYFQWGRLDDGHQVSTSTITSNLSSVDNPEHSNFILGTSDWRSPQNDNLWQGVNGINNPCPIDWRVPTQADWDIEKSAGMTNGELGFSRLKLTGGGYKTEGAGSFVNKGSSAHLWTSTVDSNYAHTTEFFSGMSYFGVDRNRARGNSVRCIKN